MDSDSELHATDTLRFDSESDEDATPSGEQSVAIKSNAERRISPAIPSSITNDLESPELPDSKKCDGVDHSQSETAHIDKGDDEETIRTSTRKAKKASKVIDSDSDEEETMLPKAPDADTSRAGKSPIYVVDRLKSLLDSESDSDSETVVKNVKNSNIDDEFKNKQNRRKPQSVLSDSEEEDIPGKNISSGNTRSKPARKKPVKKREIIAKINTAQDILASLQLRFSDEDSDAPIRDERKGEISSEEDENDKIPHERRHPKKMTVHEAMEERRVIQSETQRMKREMAIEVPYHRARERTFEEFLSRKAIRRAQASAGICERTKKRDMSLKMTPEQLEAFSQQLKELEEESKAFYKSESDSSDEAPSNPPIEKAANSAESDMIKTHELNHEPTSQEGMEQPTLDKNPPGEALNLLHIDTGVEQDETHEMDTQCAVEDAENDSHAPQDTENKKEERQREIDYDIAFEQQTESSVANKKKSLLSTLDLPPCPRLSGQPGLVIDLDGGDMQMSEPVGIDILFKRLEKCGGGKKETPKVNAVSILSTDSGIVKLDVVPVLSNEARPAAPKEPTPGAAFMKVQHVLKEQIINDRLETIKKREEEYAKKLEMERAEKGETDDEEEELLDDDEAGSSDNEDECASVAAPVLEQNNDEGDDGESLPQTSSSEEDDDDSDGEEETSCKKGRIIRAFQDSDDETNEFHASAERELLAENKKEVLSSEDLRREDDEKVVLLWKDDEEGSKEKEVEDEDLMALCSGQFVTQCPSAEVKSPSKDCAISTTPSNDLGCALYTQDDAQPVAESQLMELCSGRFETQADLQNSMCTQKEDALVDHRSPILPESTHATETPVLAGRIICLESTDDEADEPNRNDRVKRIRKRKKKHVNLSDDEESDAGEEVSKPVLHEERLEEEREDDEDDDEEMNDEGSTKGANEEIIKCIEYDSEENELEVVLSKKDKSRIAKNFVENEAELSESDWGSADEDEKGLDRYDIEMADEEQYDQRQLQRELEKIHNRQMLDQDNREVEQLKDLFLEDEEKEAGRIRQFRWKNVEKTFNLDYDKQAQDPEQSQETGDASDEETEILWRKMRHERTMLLKEKKVDLGETDEYETTLLGSANTTTLIEGQENNQSLGNVTAIGKRRLTIIKKRVATSVAPAKEEVPFLISNSSIAQGHKASFLSRDEETLSKIATLSKANPDVEGSSTAVAAKSRNFVFASLNPGAEAGSKRPHDSEESEEKSDIKRVKNNEPTQKKKLKLDSLM